MKSLKSNVLFWLAAGIFIAIFGALECARFVLWSPFFPVQLLIMGGVSFWITSTGERKEHFKPSVRFAFIGFLALLGITILNTIITTPHPEWSLMVFYKNIYPEMTARFGITGTDVLVVLLLLLLAPVAEELFYRGGVFYHLRVDQRKTAYVLSASLFGLRHALQLSFFLPSYPAALGIDYFLFTFFVGLVLAWIFEKTGSLVPCMIAHAGINLVFAPMMLLYFRGIITL